MQIRNVEPSDYASIIQVLNDWWGGRLMSDMLPKLFFVHFRETSFIAEQDGQIAGFLIGFVSQSLPDEAYIHFVGVHPDLRNSGVGRMLYEHFFETVRGYGRRLVRCVTAPVNKASIAFHQRMGFEVEPQPAEADGIPFYCDYDGPGGDRVLLVKKLAFGAKEAI
ncbi:MAG: GNAT family N-acetyltransferase [Chloroflexi bacterium]|nr:GNAT family N-acetyltransferase [Chloroflexota bacterium]MBI3762183.1 GNAT family N-acetyltransferase [Chloroflexota bacterium]